MNPSTLPSLEKVYTRMMTEMGPLAEFNCGVVPVHYNPGKPLNNKGIDFETGVLLKNFVEATTPRTILELGTFRGYSTSWLLLGNWINNFHGTVHAFEVFKEGHYGEMWYDAFGLPKEHLIYHEIPGGIWNYLDQIPERIDLLYHDTEHLPGPTKKEMELLLPRVPVGGLVLIDDMLHPDYLAMQAYLHHLFSFDDAWQWGVLPVGHGLGIGKRLR